MPLLLALLLTLLACSAWVHAQARRSGQSRAMALVVAPLGGLALTLTLVWLASGVWSHLRDKTDPLPLALDVPDEVSAMIAQARETGFGTEGHEFDLLADPVSGLVVFSFNG